VLFQVFSNIEPLHNEVTYQQAQLDRLPLLPSSSSPPWRAKDRVWYFGWHTNPHHFVIPSVASGQALSEVEG
jgi:hypothetical protein